MFLLMILAELVFQTGRGSLYLIPLREVYLQSQVWGQALGCGKCNVLYCLSTQTAVNETSHFADIGKD